MFWIFRSDTKTKKNYVLSNELITGVAWQDKDHLEMIEILNEMYVAKMNNSNQFIT